jgi:Holliday junction resolvase RusA-like endonuclease
MEEVKKGRSYTYILKGEPEALVLRRSDDVIGWNTHKERKLIADISFESQHNDRPLFSNSIALDAIFYFPIPHPIRAKIKAKHGDMHSAKPCIYLLLNFLIHSCEGILFADTYNVVHTSGLKRYDKEPRTELVITELHDKKENSPKKG